MLFLVWTVTYNDGITEIVLETENSHSETIGAKELDMSIHVIIFDRSQNVCGRVVANCY